MPYRIISRDGKFCVAKADSGEVLDGACHETRAAAVKQLQAIALSELRQQRQAAHSATFAAFDLADTVGEDDGYIYRAGKIFEAGEYPDKEFAMTAEELAASAQAFAPVAIDLEHVPSVLDGKLGTLTAVEAVGADLYGVTALPKWLDDLLQDGERKVSATLDRATKRIAGLALVRNPRVTDAALLSAFSESNEPATPQSGKSQERKRMNAWEWLTSKLSGPLSSVEMPEEVVQMAGAPPGTPPPAPAPGHPSPAPAPPAEMTPAMVAFQKQALEAQTKMRRELDRVHGEAWVQSLVHGDLIAPVERSGILAMYAALAEIEAEKPRTVSFGNDPLGQPLGEGSLLAGFKALFERRPKQMLLAEVAPGDLRALFNTPTTNPQDQPMSRDAREKFLAHTPLGQALLEKEKGGR